MAEIVKADKVSTAIGSIIDQGFWAGAGIPKGQRADFESLIINEFRLQPKLLEAAKAKPISLRKALVQASALGLEVGAHKGLAYLLPFKGEVTLIPGYKGLIKLAKQSGQIANIITDVVYEGDDIEFWRDLSGDHFKHTPRWESDVVTHAYSLIQYKDGTRSVRVFPRSRIDKVRAQSPGKNSPLWTQWYDEAAKKTVLKNHLKMECLGGALEDAIDHDNQVEQPRIEVAHVVEEPLVELPEEAAVEEPEA